MKIERSLEFVRKGEKLFGGGGGDGIKEITNSEKNHYRPYECC
jgi:hypothetical protein